MSELDPNIEEIKRIAGGVIDPALQRPLSDLKMIGDISVDGPKAEVTIVLPTHAYPNRDELANLVQNTVTSQHANIESANINFDVKVVGKQSGGSIGLKVKNVIAVGSGKGGVGKSTVSACLAYGLKEFGASVGILDADVYGPSIPHLLGTHGQPAVAERRNVDGSVIERIQPVMSTDGMSVMSIGFMIEEDQAVIWRGPMLHKLLTQFLQDTDWGELDYLIIDLPPGTGDVSLTLSQMLGLAGAVVVCTPQKVALLDAIKSIAMFKKVEIPILGVVENMTGDVFGRGGAEEKGRDLGLEFLGELPSNPEIRIKGDEGLISELFAEDSEVKPYLMNIAQNTAMQIVKSLADQPAKPVFEIL